MMRGHEKPRHDMAPHPATTIHDAALYGNVPLLTQLLDSGVDIDTTNEYRSTALLYAAKANKLEAAALLIARGASINYPNNSKTTALHCAASSGHLHMCQALVAKGGDMRARDEDWDTPLEVAKEEGMRDVCNYLEQARVESAERELREAMASGDARTMTVAVERAEEEELAPSKLIGAVHARIASLRQPQASTPRAAAADETRVYEKRAGEELAEAKRALAAMEAAAAASIRRMLYSAVAGAVLAVGMFAAVGAAVRRRPR